MRGRLGTALGGWVALALAAPLVLSAGIGLSERLLEEVTRRHGVEARARLLDWQGLVEASAVLAEADKLEAVNRFFNRLRFIDDQRHWGQRDYWATPIEMLATNGGDCEDFSIAKYFTLKALGVPMERVRITYVKAVELGQAHMVLAYYASPAAEPLILDNLVDEIRSGSERPDLVPVYSFNGEGLWMAVERGGGKRVGGPNGIGLWRDLARRMDREQRIGETPAAAGEGRS